MKNSPFLLILILFPCFLYAQSIRVSGTITTNTTWTQDTVYLTGDVFVADNVTLTVKAGTKVIALGRYKLDIKGSLYAVGQPNKFIKFSAIDTTNHFDTTSLTGWKGLHFEKIKANNDSSILQYCTVEFGRAIGLTYQERYGGGILIDSFSKLRIQNCQIVDNVAVVGGAGIQITNHSSPKIWNNIFKHNYAYFEGGAIAITNNSPASIKYNLIFENAAFDVVEVFGIPFAIGAGGGIYSACLTDTTPIIMNNFIANTFSPNGAVYDSSPFTFIANNIIVNNHWSGIYNGHQRSRSIYANNTICNNQFDSGISSSGGYIYLYNNIIRGNEPPSPRFSPNVQLLGGGPLGSNNNVGTLPLSMIGQNNIDSTTLFVNPTTEAGLSQDGFLADWRLKKGSPEIDKGTTANGLAALIGDKDYYGNARIQGATIDIGALEFSPLSTTTTISDIRIKIYPNPFTEQIWIESKDAALVGDYTVHNALGQKVMSGVLNNNDTQIISTADMAAGAYILTITNKEGKQLANSKLIKQ